MRRSLLVFFTVLLLGLAQNARAQVSCTLENYEKSSAQLEKWMTLEINSISSKSLLAKRALDKIIELKVSENKVIIPTDFINSYFIKLVAKRKWTSEQIFSGQSSKNITQTTLRKIFPDEKFEDLIFKYDKSTSVLNVRFGKTATGSSYEFFNILYRCKIEPQIQTAKAEGLAEMLNSGDIRDVQSEICKMSKSLVIKAQTKLKDLGLYKQQIDGIAGKQTLLAISQAKEKIGNKASPGDCATDSDVNEFEKLVFFAEKEKILAGKTTVCSIGKAQNCNEEQICEHATFSEKGTLRWRENSFWSNRAKEIGINCGISSDIKEAALNAKPDQCLVSQLSACEDEVVCANAIKIVEGKPTWIENSDPGSQWAKEATRRGLNCGVEKQEVLTVKSPSCDEEPELCSVVQLCQKATTAETGETNWSNVEEAKGYVALAKSNGVACGVNEKPAIVAEVENCSSDPSKCSMLELCAQATEATSKGEKSWRRDRDYQGYVDMAKTIGVSCGVLPIKEKVLQVETCESKPETCSISELCQRAISFDSGKLGWSTSDIGAPYVEFAKKVGMTCGVNAPTVDASLEPKGSEKKRLNVSKYTNRKALVIGNANYADQTALKNPINDAKAIAAKLETVGFEVTYKEDLEYRDFGRTLGDFKRSLIGSDMSVFYYAGHGIEVDNQNYLIPVDAELVSSDDVQYEAISLNSAISAALNTGKLSMVLIDACRDNPFSLKFAGGSRSIGRGLAVVENDTGPVNQIISFAAASGEVAEDGLGANSPYATALIELLDQPNLEVGKMFRLLGERVSQITGGKQQPVKRDNLRGEDIYLVVE